MNRGFNPHLKDRLQFAWAIIPNASRRRTARGRLRTCRALTEHLDRARQLYAHARTDADRQAVDDLVAEIERQRAELADDGALVRRVRQERALRSLAGKGRN